MIIEGASSGVRDRRHTAMVGKRVVPPDIVLGSSPHPLNIPHRGLRRDRPYLVQKFEVRAEFGFRLEPLADACRLLGRTLTREIPVEQRRRNVRMRHRVLAGKRSCAYLS